MDKDKIIEILRQDLKSEKMKVAGLKSALNKEKNKRIEIELLLYESVDELKELINFKNEMINILNKME